MSNARTAARSNDKAVGPYMLAFVAGALAFSAAASTQARKPAAPMSAEEVSLSIADRLFDRFAARR